MFNNLRELIATMPDEKTCRDYLIKQRWNGKPVCPYCGCDKTYVIENGKRFKCGSKDCYKKFSVTIGTVFEASNIPLSKWLPAIYLCTAHKKGISSYQLAKDIGTSQKTAWFMLHRIRTLMFETMPQLSGIIEVDETYMGRKYKSDYKGIVLTEQELEYNLRSKQKGKGVVVGMVDRENKKIMVKVFPDTNAKAIRQTIKDNIAPGSELHTDESVIYKAELQEYTKRSIKHAEGNWVVGGVHTNNVENFWGVMKRGVHGIYHHISYKHLHRYCDEFSYRYNSRKINDAARFVNSLNNLERRLDYKTLTGKK